MSKKKDVVAAWIAVIFWMFLIISFSSDSADVSDRKSSAVLDKVKPAIERVEETLKTQIVDDSKIHFYVRKNAHMFNYFVLTALIMLALRASGVKGAKLYMAAWLLATSFSMTDEYYQTFIPGRSGEVRDVLVDNVGVMIGLVAGGLLGRIGANQVHSNHKLIKRVGVDREKRGRHHC